MDVCNRETRSESMKIGEARAVYNAQIAKYTQAKTQLEKQRETLQKKDQSTATDEDTEKDQSEKSATLELSYQAVSEKLAQYQEAAGEIQEQHEGAFNEEVSKQQGEAAEEYAEEMSKIMEVARRISTGGKVPASDEQKLMEFSKEMYMAAKSAAMLNKMKKEKYDSLWEDEKAENTDPEEVANDTECSVDTPEVVAVEDTVATATDGVTAAV